MAAVLITGVSVPQSMTGYNLTDSVDFETLVAGAGNGVKFAFDNKDIVILRNGTAGDAVYTFKVRVPDGFTTYGVTITDPTITVGAGDDVLMRVNDIFKDSNTQVVIECDVAGEVLVLNL